MSLARSYNPIWYVPTLDGQPMDGSYYFFTLENTLPYLPQTVYKTSSGTPWSNPIQVLNSGTLPENIYWDTEKTYRLEWRNGPTQADALIYVVENYQPLGSTSPTPGATTEDTTNQITNPQFATLNFTGTLTISSATSTEIAPGWFIETTGTGSLDVTQVTYSGDSYSPSNATNASTGITLTNSGFDLVELKQRFQGNGALWTGAESTDSDGPGVAVSFTASSGNNGDIQAWIEYSGGAEDTQIGNVSGLGASNEDYQFAQPILISTNTDGPDVAYTDFVLKMTDSTTYNITSVQLIGQEVVEKVLYIQTTPERQVDEEFNVYKPQLEYKPIPSHLVGWDFPLNPAQLFGSSVAASATGNNKSKYVWDQTIIFQGTSSGISVSRGGSGELLLTAAASTKMGVIQYLPAAEARKILNSPICCNVSARASASTVATVSLWYTTDVSLPNVATGTNNSLVASLDANGKPDSFNGTWLEVPRAMGNAQITIETSANTNFNDYPLSGWDMQGIAACNTATFFAVVVGTAVVASPNTVGFNSISLQSGYIATRPAPQAPDEVIRECAYYYETSKNTSVAITSSPLGGALIRPMAVFQVAGPTAQFWPRSFGIEFLVSKRTVPVVTLYAEEGGSSGIVRGFIRSGTTTPSGESTLTVATYWTTNNITPVTLIGNKGIQYRSIYNTTANGIFSGTAATAMTNITEAFISFHYEADARLGIV